MLEYQRDSLKIVQIYGEIPATYSALLILGMF